MQRIVSSGSRLALAALVAGTLTCGGDGTSPSTPAKLGIMTQPSSSAQNGVPLDQQPVVQIQDANGDAVASPGASITAGIAAGTGATLTGSLVKSADAQGRATFTDLSLSGPAGTYTIQFTSSGLTSAMSNAITLDAPAGAGLVVTTQPPATALTGEVWDPATQPAVKLTDAAGNPSSGVTVTASVASGSGTLDGGLTATTDAAGIARFQDLGITGTGAHSLQFATGALSATSSTVTLSSLPPEATTGRWGPVVPWDIVPLHMHLLYTGKILGWGRTESDGTMGQPRLWDPSSGQPPTSAAKIDADTMLFCAGHAFLPDGRLLVSGGHKSDDHGLDVTNIFDPSSESWVSGLPKMARGRWYPTVTELPDGRMLTVAGRDTTGNGQVVTLPEIWDGTHWTQLTGASKILPYYPRDFVAPDGRIFAAGELPQSFWLDVSANGGTGQWTNGPSHVYTSNREYGSAVMYEKGKILYVGGGGDPAWNTPGINPPEASVPTATAETIDLNGSNPQWQSTGSMAFARRHLNATVLPDGKVLVTGGTSAGGFNDLSGSVHDAEIWDPATGDWTTLAANAVNRAYHSVSVLLPDATVLHGASGNADDTSGQPFPDEKSHEIFQPPYLFKGARPTISSVPATVSYASDFQLGTPNVGQVAKVRIIKLGSVTHAFDQDGRALTLAFTSSVGGVSVTAPANANLAPPGYYMVFILNRNGVPSAGKMVKLQ
jgi:hypothetical protein